MQKVPFLPNQLYRRSSIHDLYGGNRQAGIAPSANFAFIFIFSGKSGSQYGYKDEWVNPKVFTYTGEGQIGDMRFVKGNLALRDHIKNGKRVFLFELEKAGFVKFISELSFYDVDFLDALDLNKNNRVAIRFFFTPVGVHLPVAPDQLKSSLLNEDQPDFLVNSTLPNKTERTGLVTSRVGQGAYRKSIIHRWEYQCAVTGFTKLEALIASHIIPWAKSTDEERLDVNNGILLSPTYDALFDRHLISFDDKGKILLSDSIEIKSYQLVGISGNERIKNLSQFNQKYLSIHQTKLFSS
jgi:5-methylcytosine-specific restriction protein A